MDEADKSNKPSVSSKIDIYNKRQRGGLNPSGGQLQLTSKRDRNRFAENTEMAVKHNETGSTRMEVFEELQPMVLLYSSPLDCFSKSK